jgi:hypothetical protein
VRIFWILHSVLTIFVHILLHISHHLDYYNVICPPDQWGLYLTSSGSIIFVKKLDIRPGVMVHTCNLSYSESGDLKTHGLWTAQAKC